MDRWYNETVRTPANINTIWEGKETFKKVAEDYCKENKIKIDLNKTTYGDLTKEPFISIIQTSAWKKAEKKAQKEKYSYSSNYYRGFSMNFDDFDDDFDDDNDIEDIIPIEIF